MEPRRRASDFFDGGRRHGLCRRFGRGSGRPESRLDSAPFDHPRGVRTRSTHFAPGRDDGRGAQSRRPRSLSAAGQSELDVAIHADLKNIDRIWTTALITSNHGYAIYDTLFGTDANFEPQPQMAEGYTVSDDDRVYTITLRDGFPIGLQIVGRMHEDQAVLQAAAAFERIAPWADRRPSVAPA